MDSIGKENRKHIQNVTVYMRDALHCGAGLFYFARWCANAAGIENMTIICSGREWHEDHIDDLVGHFITNEEGLAAYRDLDGFDKFLGMTTAAINSAFDIGKKLYRMQSITGSLLRKLWYKALYEMDFDCECCDDGPCMPGMESIVAGECSMKIPSREGSAASCTCVQWVKNNENPQNKRTRTNVALNREPSHL